MTDYHEGDSDPSSSKGIFGIFRNWFDTDKKDKKKEKTEEEDLITKRMNSILQENSDLILESKNKDHSTSMIKKVLSAETLLRESVGTFIGIYSGCLSRIGFAHTGIISSLNNKLENSNIELRVIFQLRPIEKDMEILNKNPNENLIKLKDKLTPIPDDRKTKELDLIRLMRNQFFKEVICNPKNSGKIKLKLLQEKYFLSQVEHIITVSDGCFRREIDHGQPTAFVGFNNYTMGKQVRNHFNTLWKECVDDFPISMEKLQDIYIDTSTQHAPASSGISHANP